MQEIPRDQGRAICSKVESESQTREMKKCAERIWNAISKYVPFDNDAIFKAPNCGPTYGTIKIKGGTGETTGGRNASKFGSESETG